MEDVSAAICQRGWIELGCVKYRYGCVGQTESVPVYFCGPRFPHSHTESNYIVCDFCGILTELSGLSI